MKASVQQRFSPSSLVMCAFVSDRSLPVEKPVQNGFWSEEARRRRRRWDCYFIPFVCVAGVFAAFGYWQLDHSYLLLIPVVPVVVWMNLRFAHNPKGELATTWKAVPLDVKSFLRFEVWWFGVAVICFVAFLLIDPSKVLRQIVAVTLLLTWLGGLVWRLHRLDHAHQQHNGSPDK